MMRHLGTEFYGAQRARKYPEWKVDHSGFRHMTGCSDSQRKGIFAARPK
jgi:hypothetical protein